MKFQKGNKLWMNVDPEKLGRPPEFKNPVDLWKKCCKYFQFIDENPFLVKETTTYDKESEQGTQKKESKKPKPYTWDGLYTYLCISHLDYYKENKPEFLGIIEAIGKVIRNQKFEGAAAGLFNANIIARELGLKEYTDINQKTEEIQTQFVVSDKETAKEVSDFINEIKNAPK